MSNTHPSFALADYLTAVKMAVDERFCQEVWVQAQIRAVNHKGGHTYFELAQSDEKGQIVASCRATLWKFKANVISRFETMAGTPLCAGLAVLIKGKASFHAQYGFSFNISDIDPNYTLGALLSAYHTMKNKLADNGLLTLNQSVPMPFDLQKIAVIAPQNGAGLGDFRAESDRLERLGVCQFDYYTATFQGNTAPFEIRKAIGQVLADGVPDLLVIIRGGGAVGDLAYLNDYELAAMLAECPMPVWVGVGHQRDRVLLDEVAHTSFDTPSKVIQGIIEFLAQRWGNVKAYFKSIQHSAKTQLYNAKVKQNDYLMQVKSKSLHRLNLEKLHLTGQLTTIQKESQRHIALAKSDIRHYQTLILSHNPAHLLNKGYALIKKNDTFIKSINDLQTGDRLVLQLSDGKVSVVVQ